MNENATHHDNIHAGRMIDPPGVPEGLTGTIRVTSHSIKAGDTVQVTWSAKAPTSGYRYQLNGFEVPASGTHAYRPLADTTYTLTATIAASRITLARQSVAVDSSGCTIQGRTLDEPVLKALLGSPIYAMFNRAAGVTFSKGPFNAHVWLNAAADVRVVLENDAQLVQVAIPLHLAIDGLPGEPSLTITAWFSLVLSGGSVYAMLARTSVDLSVPPELVIAASALGFEGLTVLALLRSIAPSIIADEVRGPLTTIAQVFGLLGDRVISVRFEIDSDSNPFINTTVCP